MEYIRSSMGDQYAKALISLTPIWVGYAMLGMLCIGSVIGAFTGRKFLNKHFTRAGIV